MTSTKTAACWYKAVWTSQYWYP